LTDGTKTSSSSNSSSSSSSRSSSKNNNNGQEPQQPKTAPQKQEGQKPDIMNGPKMITFDGDQTLYTDGANFESNPLLATYLYQLLKHGVIVAVVTAAGYEYNVEKYEFRLSGLLAFFKEQSLTEEECARFYLFGGECNYLLRLGSDYHLHAVKENGAGGWLTSTKYIKDSPANWNSQQITNLLDVAERSIRDTVLQLNVRGMVIRKRRAIGLIPKTNAIIPREVLDEAVLRVQETLESALKGGAGEQIMMGNMNNASTNTAAAGLKRDARGVPVFNKVTNSNPLSTQGIAPNNNIGTGLPYCAFNGGKDCWFDVGNKRVGVQILQSYLGIPKVDTLHIGDQFLNTGNDFAARDVCPCIWITSPEETTFILKSILRLADLPVTALLPKPSSSTSSMMMNGENPKTSTSKNGGMNVYTGEIISGTQ